MLINEVCKECKLTKKAIEYYEEQGLVKPKMLGNGYRDFSDENVERLQRIAVLRRLGLSAVDIRSTLNSKDRVVLNSISGKKALELEALKTKQQLVQKLAQDGDWEYISLQLETLENKQSILERLTDLFPGHYGKYVSLHFGLYLNEPIETPEQQQAFDTIIAFLDSVNFHMPTDLKDYLDQATRSFDEKFAADMSQTVDKALRNPEKYIEDNQEVLEQYLAFKQSDEYKSSPAYRLLELFKEFNSASGYYDVFIPAMKVLSRSYRDYQLAMERADIVFAEKYPADLAR